MIGLGTDSFDDSARDAIRAEIAKMHELALHGFWEMALDTAARAITRRTEPHVKLH